MGKKCRHLETYAEFDNGQEVIACAACDERIGQQVDWVTDPNEAKVEYGGNTYHIFKDVRTDANYPHPPSWYVVRASDGYVSKRYYSQPQGAFTALVTGAVQWVS